MKHTVILRITSLGRQTSSMYDFSDLASALLYLHRTIGEYVCAEFEVLGSGPFFASLRHGDRTATICLVSLSA